MTKDTLGPMETTSLADQAYRRLRDAIRGAPCGRARRSPSGISRLVWE